MTEAPGFSSALVAASARLAEAGRKLRRDPRIREVFEGIDLDEGRDGTTISSYLDVSHLTAQPSAGCSMARSVRTTGTWRGPSAGIRMATVSA